MPFHTLLPSVSAGHTACRGSLCEPGHEACPQAVVGCLPVRQRQGVERGPGGSTLRPPLPWEAPWSPRWVQGQAFRCCDVMPVTAAWARARGCRPCPLPPPRPTGLACIGQGGQALGWCRQGADPRPRHAHQRCHQTMPRSPRVWSHRPVAEQQQHLPGWRTSGCRLAGWVGARRSLCPEASGAGVGPAPAPGSCWGPWALPPEQALPDLIRSDHDPGER